MEKLELTNVQKAIIVMNSINKSLEMEYEGDWSYEDEIEICNETISDWKNSLKDYNEKGKIYEMDNKLAVVCCQVLKNESRYNLYIVELDGKTYVKKERAFPNESINITILGK